MNNRWYTAAVLAFILAMATACDGDDGQSNCEESCKKNRSAGCTQTASDEPSPAPPTCSERCSEESAAAKQCGCASESQALHACTNGDVANICTAYAAECSSQANNYMSCLAAATDCPLLTGAGGAGS
jgi:hypothetical protein